MHSQNGLTHLEIQKVSNPEPGGSPYRIIVWQAQYNQGHTPDWRAATYRWCSNREQAQGVLRTEAKKRGLRLDNEANPTEARND